ncbi:glycosyltransferase family 39 protein [Candidatus Peregrinibacteria bacterium]|nr:glycosyltransferase family 39 protein [Candidatus Peregrinibacteria bacterium]
MPSSFWGAFGEFCILNVFVFASALHLSLAFLKYRPSSWGKLLLSIFIFASLQIFLSQIFLGIWGILSFFPLFSLNGVIFGSVFTFFGRKVLYSTKFPPKPEYNAALFFLLFSPFFSIFLFRFFTALFELPLEYDSVAYHLPFVVEWFQTHSIMSIYYSAFAGPIGYYPSNFELTSLWMLLPFGKDYFINLVNFPLYFVSGFGIFLISRNLKISTEISLLAAAIFLYIPEVLWQMGTPMVDLYLVTVLISAFYFLQEFAMSRNFSDLTLFGFSLGLLIGTKYLGLPYGFFPGVLALLFLIFFFWKRKRNVVWGMGILFFTIVLGGGFWYFRNVLDVGNPLFPLEVKIFGNTLFEGYHGITEKLLNSSMLSSIQSPEDLRNMTGVLRERIGTASLLFASIPILLLFVFLKTVFTARRGSSEKKLDILISLLLFGGFLYYFYFYIRAPYTDTLFDGNVRFSFPFLAIASIGVSFVISRLKILAPILTFLVFLSIFSNILLIAIQNSAEGTLIRGANFLDISFITEQKNLFLLFLITIFFLSLGYFFLMKTGSGKKYIFFAFASVIFSIIFAVLLLENVLPLQEKYAPHFFEKWLKPEATGRSFRVAFATRWLDVHAPYATIAYTGFNFHYYLFGRNLQRKVDYININDCAQCRYKDFKDDVLSIRQNPNYSAWLSNLRQYQKEYLVIALSIFPNLKNWEFEWVKEHPEIFEEVYNDADEVYIYRVKNVQ